MERFFRYENAPIPELPGICEEALAFYASCHDGTIVAMVPHAGSPMEAAG
jgi:uncharacterized glyoxalase superfamily protein PhnB